MFAAFILLPTRFWPKIDRELPFLAIALYFYPSARGFKKKEEREYVQLIGAGSVATFAGGRMGVH